MSEKSLSRLGGFRRALSVCGALALTPLLMFITTTNALFIEKADSFANDVGVLNQFLGYAAVTFLFGILLYLLARFSQQKFLSMPIWGYLIVGPVFLVYGHAHLRNANLMDSYLVLALLALACIGLAFRFAYVIRLDTGVSLARTTFIFFLAIEAYVFLSNGDSRTFPADDALTQVAPLDPPALPSPNVYHIIFDAFGANLFDETLTENVRSSLAGYTYYPDTIAGYSGTYVSIPSMFRGDFYDASEPPISYMTGAFDSERSILQQLTAADYETYAYLPFPLVDTSTKQFRHVLWHSKRGDTRFLANSSVEFRNFWLVKYFPSLFIHQVMSEDAINDLKNPMGALPKIQPIQSYASFRRFLREEEGLAETNRYTFMHLVIPHAPFVLHADGSFREPLADGTIPTTSRMEQSECATRMIVEFTERLQELGRFKDSLIVIHGDHGAFYRTRPGQIERIRYATPMMLVKLPGKTSSSELQIDDAETHLIDIAPTILNAVDIESDVPYEGVALGPGIQITPGRVRPHNVYQASIGPKWTAESIVPYVFRGREFIAQETGRTIMEADATADPRSLFNEMDSANRIRFGGFEKFPQGNNYPVGWGGLLRPPLCEPEEREKHFENYSLKISRRETGEDNNGAQFLGTTTAPPIEELRGKKVTFGMWVNTPHPENVKVVVIDSWKNHYSAGPTEANTWQLVLRSVLVPASAQQIFFVVSLSESDDTQTMCYVDGAVLNVQDP